jgi:hypothetical protein
VHIASVAEDHLNTTAEMDQYLDPTYMRDKSIKKVSLATLKRRKKEQDLIEKQQKDNSLKEKKKGPVQSTLNRKD